MRVLVLVMLLLITRFVTAGVIVPVGLPGNQFGLEYLLCHGCIIPDYFPEGEPPYVPMRNRDALAEFYQFFERSGWTTNQFIKGLINAANGHRCKTALGWSEEENERITGNAIWKLGEINNPSVTNYFRELIASQSVDCIKRFGSFPVLAMFCHTNLEPEVLDYMKSICNQTNLYEKIASEIVYDMRETLGTMPAELRVAATNRLAKYMYYSIRHSTRAMTFQDRELAELVPLYSNSIQRLEAMQYVKLTSTNVQQRMRAQVEMDRLIALPTNQLNDVSWITQDWWQTSK